MKIRVYTIFDRLAQECGPLFSAKNDAVAIRGFRIALKESREDEHQLLFVGEFDTEHAHLEGLGAPQEIVVQARLEVAN
jgi:hypothetical protein